MQEGQNARQQVVERIRQSTSILVAVGNNPSVDALAAALGLSLMLNKLNKHTTTVFSGQTPPAIQFLEPNKTFENNVDALRDFIISLDKEKADRLRYKVEDDVVRIFITPYKTSISEKDLQYSQGDFNVDLIIALGVEKREELDQAIIAHGRILHDATVVTVNPSNQRSSLGSIDWNDSAASSLCEMLVGVSEAFQQPGLLDAQISTALLTGIVSATDRFSNPRTSPRVMTMAAQLMAAGANQQLIATNLERAKQVAAPTPAAEPSAGPVAKQAPTEAPKLMQEEPVKKKELGELDIVHEKQEPLKVTPPAPAPLPPAAPVAPEPQLTEQQEKELEAALPTRQVQHNLLPDINKELEAAAEPEAPKEPGVSPEAPGSQSVNVEGGKKEDGEGDYLSTHTSWKGKRLEPPTLGGTLNATTEEAMEATKKAEDADRNKKLLTHPADASMQGQNTSKNKRKRDRNRDNKQGNGEALAAAPAVAAPAVLSPEATQPPALPPAPTPIEQPPITTAPVLPPQPAPASEPVAPPEFVMPPQPVSQPVAPLPELPPAPAPVVVEPPAPVAPQVPALAPLPEPPAPAAPTAPEPDLDALQQEVAATAAQAAAVAQPAENTAGDLDSARQAVTQAFDNQPFNPAGQPLAGVGAQEMPQMPGAPAAVPPPQDVPQPLPPPAPVMPAPPEPVTPAPAPVTNDLPPLPPMPPLPTSGTDLPPAPDLPGLNTPLPPMTPTSPPADQPPANPPTADPGQFKIPGV